MTPEPRRGDWIVWLGGAAIVGALIRLVLAFEDVGFVGWDTYPLIEVSRIRAPADLLWLFSTSLLGDAEGGLYYRPLPKLTLALDYAIWNLWAPGYHATSVVLLGALVAAIHRLASRLFGRGGSIGAMMAALLVVLHPIQATVLPVPARRADVLALAFMALCLDQQIRAADGGRGARIGTVLFGGLALLSKETAFILPPLAFLVAYLYAAGSGRTGGERVWRAVWSVAPLAGVTLAVSCMRFGVLGGWVGDRPLLESGFVATASRHSRNAAELIFSGSGVVGELDWAPVALLAALLATAVAHGLASADVRRSVREDRAHTLPLVFVWLAAVMATYVVGMIFQPWYALHPLAVVTLLLGALVDGLVTIARSSRRARPAVAVAGVGFVIFATSIAAHSPAFHSTGDWLRMSALTEGYLAELRPALIAASPGSTLPMPRAPQLLPRRRGEDALVGVAGIAGYSIEAWARLELPGLRVRAVAAEDGDVAKSDEILVLLGARPARRGLPGRRIRGDSRGRGAAR